MIKNPLPMMEARGVTVARHFSESLIFFENKKPALRRMATTMRILMNMASCLHSKNQPTISHLEYNVDFLEKDFGAGKHGSG
jgi:hypothetical protein